MKTSVIIAGNFLYKKSAEADKQQIIEGIVSTEFSDRDYDVVPPSAFKIAQYMQNPQVWYNHGMWKDANGNEIPIGKTLELYSIRIQKVSDEANDLAIIATDTGNLIGLITKERMTALSLKEGDSGLWARIRIDVAEVWDMIKKGTLNAFSWQGRAEAVEIWNEGKKVYTRQLSSIDLMEISVVTIPADERSYFTMAKSFEGILAKTETVVKEDANDLEYIVTDPADDGHYHEAEIRVVGKMCVGRTTRVKKGKDHVHPINAYMGKPVSGISNTSEEHFHKFSVEHLVAKSVSVSKWIWDYADLPIAPEDVAFSISKEDVEKASNSGKLLDMYLYYNEELPLWIDKEDELTGRWTTLVNQEALKFPIASYIDGVLLVNFSAVEKAMGELLGNNHGLQIQDYVKAYANLAKYYKKFGKELPKKQVELERDSTALGKVDDNHVNYLKKAVLKTKGV